MKVTLKKFMSILLPLIVLFGCSDAEKIKELKRELQDEQETNSRLWRDRSSLRNELSRIRDKLKESNEKIKSFQKNQNLTKDMITLLASDQTEDAIRVAKSINQGLFDEIDRLMIVQNKLIADIHREEKIRQERDKISVKEQKQRFHRFMISSVICLLQLLVVSVLAACFILMGFLIYKGQGITDKLVRSGGVIGFLILYFISSFYGISLSSLMLSSAVVSTPVWEICVRWAIPLIAGAFFALTIKHQIEKEHFYAERWMIVITTLLFCMLLDVFLKVETGLGDRTIPVANATFVVGLFITLFLNMKPEQAGKRSTQEQSESPFRAGRRGASFKQRPRNDERRNNQPPRP